MPTIITSAPAIEEHELLDVATERDMAVADRLLAVLLVQLWQKQHSVGNDLTCSASHGSLSGEDTKSACNGRE